MEKHDCDIALICNPAAGGRWRELAKIFDSAEAKNVRRIVTDEIGDIEIALSALGQRVKLLCIYGGDGTIQQIVTQLLRRGDANLPALAFLGGGTMNLATAWTGWGTSPADNFREIVRRHLSDQQRFTESALLEIRQGARQEFGFTFGLGPMIRVLDKYEHGKKGKLAAIAIGAKAFSAATMHKPPELSSLMDSMPAEVELDGKRLPYDGYSAIFCNVTGQLHLGVHPFGQPRTRETFHVIAYAIKSSELAVMLPFLAFGKVPIDPAALLRPVNTTTQLAMSVLGGTGALPLDPRYVNEPASRVIVRTPEPVFTIDGEILESTGEPFELSLGPTIRAVAGPGRTPKVKSAPPAAK